MARARKLLWLSAFAGLAYVVWRWRAKQAEATPLPAYTPPPTPPAVAPPRPAPSAEAPTTRAGETTGAPRRIPTRVHRGAPPSPAGAADTAPATPPAAPAEPDTPPEPPPAAVALEAAVGAEKPADEAEPAEGVDLAPLVGAGAAEPEGVDLAPLVGAGAASDVVDLAPLVSAEAAETASSFSGALVNLNTADLDALVALPGIGQALARRIIAYREEHGPFASVEQLVDVQGIGERNLDEFRHLITV